MSTQVNIVDGTRLVMVIDFSHEPWRTFALAMLTKFNDELEDVGLTISNFDVLLDVVYQTKGDIQ